jgi:hypothetical protein
MGIGNSSAQAMDALSQINSRPYCSGDAYPKGEFNYPTFDASEYFLQPETVVEPIINSIDFGKAQREQEDYLRSKIFASMGLSRGFFSDEGTFSSGHPRPSPKVEERGIILRTGEDMPD